MWLDFVPILLGYRKWLESKGPGRRLSGTTHKRYCKQGQPTWCLPLCPKKVVPFGKTVGGGKERLQQIVPGHKRHTVPRVQPHMVKKETRGRPVPASRPSAQPGIFLKLTGVDEAGKGLVLTEPSVEENSDRVVVPVEPLKKTTPLKAMPTKKTTLLKASTKKSAPLRVEAVKSEVMQVAMKIMKSAPTKAIRISTKVMAARRRPARQPARAPVRRRPGGRRF